MGVSCINEKRDQRLGLELLRAVMSFCVVLIHFWNTEKLPVVLIPLAGFIHYAVPVFMFMSFFLTQRRFLAQNTTYNKRRLWKLIWPQIAWTVIYFGVYTVTDKMMGTGIIKAWSDFFWQLFTGHSPKINAAMWYQIALICLTLLFILIFNYLTAKKGVVAICGLLIFSIWWQYSGLNEAVFADLRSELKYPLGRLFEMIPYATTAFLVSYFQIHRKLEKYRVPSLLGMILITGIFMKYSFISNPPGYGYSGVQKILIAFGLIMAAWLLPVEKLPAAATKIITVLSRYTFGIYCMHNLVGRFMKTIFSSFGVPSETLFMCIVVYVTCYIIAFIISKIPIKLCKQLVE